MIKLYVGNTNVVELQNLKNTITGEYDTTATVTVTLKDGAGTNVSGESWPVSMTHEANGTYRATLSNSLDLRRGGRYYAIVDATGTGGEIGKWEKDVHAETRK